MARSPGTVQRLSHDDGHPGERQWHLEPVPGVAKDPAA